MDLVCEFSFVELEIHWNTCLESVELASYTYAMNGAFEDPIGLAGVDCGSPGSVGMLHLCHLLPFFE